MKQMSLPRQLLLFMSTCAVMTLIVSCLFYWQQMTALRESAALTHAALNELNGANQLQEEISSIQRGLQSVLREKDPDEIEKVVVAIDVRQKNALQYITKAKGRAVLLQSKFTVLAASQKSVLEAFLLGNGGLAYDRLNGEYTQRFNEISDEIRNYYTSVQKETETLLAAAQEKRRVAMLWLSAIVGVIVLALFFAGWRLKCFIAGQMQGISDLLANSSQELDESSHKVSNASRSVAEGATQQAASLQETSASMEEMLGMTRRNANSAEQAKQIAGNGRMAAEKAARDVNSMTEALHAIARSSQELRLAMDKISSSSSAITQIMKTIDEIAFQTNILSINAAVEAARAGESGAGFAVVADEVRALARRSADAAKETAQMIKESSDSSHHGMDVTEKVSADLQNINKTAEMVNDSLLAIVEQVRQVDEIVGEISGACQKQNLGIEQVNSALSAMDQVTQSNAAGAEESAAATEELKAQAGDINCVAVRLQVLVQGEGKDRRSVAAKSEPPSVPAPSTAAVDWSSDRSRESAAEVVRQ